LCSARMVVGERWSTPQRQLEAGVPTPEPTFPRIAWGGWDDDQGDESRYYWADEEGDDDEKKPAKGAEGKPAGGGRRHPRPPLRTPAPSPAPAAWYISLALHLAGALLGAVLLGAVYLAALLCRRAGGAASSKHPPSTSCEEPKDDDWCGVGLVGGDEGAGERGAVAIARKAGSHAERTREATMTAHRLEPQLGDHFAAGALADFGVRVKTTDKGGGGSEMALLQEDEEEG